MAVEDVIADAKSRLESLIAPVDGGVGVDVSYDPAFETLKNEVDKLQALSGGKVDWGSVAAGADQLLSEKSKDFRVALYYSTAKAHTDGLGGLLDGFVVLTELVAAYWEPMYPPLKRPKARGNLMTWFGDLVSAQFQTYVPTAAEGDLVRAIERTSTALDGELRDKLGDNYPGIMNVRNLVRNLVASIPAPVVAAAPPPPPVAPPPQVAGAPAPVAAQPQPQPVAAAPAASFAAPTAPSGNAEEALDFVVECGRSIVTAADSIRAADPGNPASYRFRRAGAWIRLAQTPPNDGGRTIVPAPPESLKQELDGLMAAENYVGVIAAAEEIVGTYILWLDPHRYVANAMDRLGAIFINAKKAVVFEVAILVSRLSQLPNLSFDDGTPFADGQTKMWLEAEVQSAFGSGSKGGGGNGAASALDAPIVEARTLAASGKLAEAIEVVSNAAASASSGADRFRGRLAVAKLCLQSGQFAIARAQLEGLVWLTEQHKLAEWEPSLCADLYSALYSAHRGLNKGDEVPADARARENAAFERLCQLDANLALKLSEG